MVEFGLLVFSVVLVGMVVSGYLAVVRSKRMLAELKAGGFQFRKMPDGKLVGEFMGRKATLETAKENKIPVAYVGIAVEVGDFGLSVSKAGLLSRLGVKQRMYDVEIGDPDFDRSFHVETNDPERAARFLDRDTRAWLAERKFRSLDVWKGKLTVAFPVVSRKTQPVLDAMVAIRRHADRLESVAGKRT